MKCRKVLQSHQRSGLECGQRLPDHAATLIVPTAAILQESCAESHNHIIKLLETHNKFRISKWIKEHTSTENTHGRHSRDQTLLTQPVAITGSENLETHRTITVPTAILCAASSIHHSPLSQIDQFPSSGGALGLVDCNKSPGQITLCNTSSGTYNFMRRR